MPKIKKTTFQEQVSFRYDLLGGELLTKITRELSKTRKLLPNVSNDHENLALLWRGAGIEGDPYWQVRVTPNDIFTFAGFFAGAEEWSKFRQDVRDVILEALRGIEPDFVAHLTGGFSWVVAASAAGKLKELITFSHLVVPEDLDQPERFSMLLFSPTTKQRVLFEGFPEGDEFRFGFNVQTNQMESSLAQTFDNHFASADTAYAKANSFVESLMEG